MKLFNLCMPTRWFSSSQGEAAKPDEKPSAKPPESQEKGSSVSQDSEVPGLKREALEDLLKQLLHATPEERLAAQKAAGSCREKDAAVSAATGSSTLPSVPSMAEHAREIGNKYFKDRHFLAAVQCYEVACLLCPSGPECPTEQLASYHCNCALACLELGRFSDTITECHAALVLSPPTHLAAKALYRLAVAHAYLKNPWQASRCLQQCSELDPLNAYAQALLEHLTNWQVEEDKRKAELNLLPRPRLEPLVWTDIGRRLQGPAQSARDKAKSKKAKQKGGSAMPEDVRLFDREAGLWHTMARHNSKLYILGGLPDCSDSPPWARSRGQAEHGSTIEACSCGSDELHVLDIDSLEFRQPSGPGSKPPHACYCHTATVVGNSMIVFGGLGPPLDQPPAVMVFDFIQAKWKVPQVSGNPPRQRQGHTANAVQEDQFLCVFGGLELTSHAGVARVHGDTHLLDVTSFAWRRLECGGCRPAARFGHTATNLPGQAARLLVIGGRDHFGKCKDSLACNHTGLHILDIERRVWQEQVFSGAPPEEAFYHSACLIDEQTLLVACSGRCRVSGEDVVPLYVLDLEAWCWSRPSIQGLQPSARIGHTLAAIGNRMYLFGGMVQRGNSMVVDKAVHVLETPQPKAAVAERDEATRQSSPASVANGEKQKDKAERGKAERSRAEVIAKELESDWTQVSCSADALEPKEPKEEHREPKALSHEDQDESADLNPENSEMALPPAKQAASTTASKTASEGSWAETPPTTNEGAPLDGPRTNTAVAGSTEKGVPLPPLANDRSDLLPGGNALDMEDEEFDDDEPELSFEELLEQEKAFFKAQREMKASFPRAQEARNNGEQARNNNGRKK
eukprot:TRINITY_DN20545_c0_g1_i1.p1 TRINITY_DN20545_c0_g1~~TRINITY_DN20545_c0_g1_i1.p1  ORF type:complete len:855 (-),score=162.30 TRINITY_DN20545_c0_g1_i1:14-2578(-)